MQAIVLKGKQISDGNFKSLPVGLQMIGQAFGYEKAFKTVKEILKSTFLITQ